MKKCIRQIKYLNENGVNKECQIDDINNISIDDESQPDNDIYSDYSNSISSNNSRKRREEILRNDRTHLRQYVDKEINELESDVKERLNVIEALLHNTSISTTTESSSSHSTIK